MKYNEVASHFSRAKYPSKGKPMQSNVRIHMEEEGTYVLKLHGKTIISWLPNGVIILSDCGYKTPTTYRNMNRYLPSSIRVYRKNYKTEVDLRRNYIHNDEPVWTQTKHITKPVYDGEPTNFHAVSPPKQKYGRRASFITLEPHDNGTGEYRLAYLYEVIV